MCSVVFDERMVVQRILDTQREDVHGDNDDDDAIERTKDPRVRCLQFQSAADADAQPQRAPDTPTQQRTILVSAKSTTRDTGTPGPERVDVALDEAIPVALRSPTVAHHGGSTGSKKVPR